MVVEVQGREDIFSNPSLKYNPKRVKIGVTRGYKRIFMLNSTEHDFLNVHKYKNIKKFSIFQAQTNIQWHFF